MSLNNVCNTKYAPDIRISQTARVVSGSLVWRKIARTATIPRIRRVEQGRCISIVKFQRLYESSEQVKNFQRTWVRKRLRQLRTSK